jgi:hypothetical protein
MFIAAHHEKDLNITTSILMGIQSIHGKFHRKKCPLSHCVRNKPRRKSHNTHHKHSLCCDSSSKNYFKTGYYGRLFKAVSNVVMVDYLQQYPML